MALTKQEAVQILMERYEISQREAQQNFEFHLEDRRMFATSVITGLRDPNIPVHFKDKKEYTTYLQHLEDNIVI